MENEELVEANEEEVGGSAAPAEETENDVQAQESGSQESIDYKAEYEREKERRSKAEFTLYKKNKEERERRKTQENNQEEVVEVTETKKHLEEEMQSMFAAQRQKDAEDFIEEEIFRLSSDPDERRLIRLKYDTGVVKTGFSHAAIREDLDDAKFLANKAKFQKEQKELAKTAVSKRTMATSAPGSSVGRPIAKEDLSKHFSANDWNFMQSRGWSDDQIRKALKKST